MKTLLTCCILSALLTTAPLRSEVPVTAPPVAFQNAKYGLFVHYVWGGTAYSATVNKDGSMPAGLDDVADRFDADVFADDLAAMGVEYVLFTAWHANMNVLYPSKVMDRWLPGHSSKRDLLGDLIKACKARNISVLLYTHPRDGHDFTAAEQARTGWADGRSPNPDWAKFNKRKWNDFINDAYGELVDRYGNDILGIYLDEGSGEADSHRVVDYPRLRKTITAKHPGLLMMQNDYGNLYTCDIGNKEIYYTGPFAKADGNQWPSYKIPISIVVGSIFWAAFPEGAGKPAHTSKKVSFNKWIPYTPGAMFRYTVLQSATNRDGGGVLWAAGTYPGGGWERGVLDRMKKTGALIKPVESSIKNTSPSTSYVTVPGTTIAQLKWGVATRSPDGKAEFLHILNPPAGGARSLKLPPPADGKIFTKAELLADGRPVELVQDAAGLALTLPQGASWDANDTVIKLTVAENSPAQNAALWKILRASSHTDNAHHPGKATDGESHTSWLSHRDDRQPWALLDLGSPFRISRIEVVGSVGKGAVLKASNSWDFSDSEELARYEAGVEKLEIRKARYGNGSQSADVTAKLRSLQTVGGLNVTADNSLCGKDPAPNKTKELTVDYTLGGKPESASVREGETLSISDSKPWIFDVPGRKPWRFLRIEKPNATSPLSVSELRVMGKPE